MSHELVVHSLDTSDYHCGLLAKEYVVNDPPPSILQHRKGRVDHVANDLTDGNADDEDTAQLGDESHGFLLSNCGLSGPWPISPAKDTFFPGAKHQGIADQAEVSGYVP